MVDSSLLTLPIILGGAAFFLLLVLVVGYRVLRGMQKQIGHSRQQLRAFEKERQKSDNQLLEVRSVVVGLGQKVTEQEDVIRTLIERVKELEQEDNDGRLYTRASKMVQLGADIDELIEECELPKAEAELMMSLQNKIKGKEKVPPLGGVSSRKPTRQAPPRRVKR